jgi:formylglycine-generating enzyme required for sulfatase activity
MEGLTPCYDLSDWSCDWSADGYRLPTEAEWEKAARGGAAGHRFPWDDVDTIDHTRANYESRWSFEYDASTTRGHHPVYGVGEYPYTCPVGSFEPNGYGLYNVAGNVWEWVWDRYDGHYYMVSPSVDPRGPEAGDYRVLRSGRWGYDADNARVSGRRHGWPAGRRRMGFRVVLPVAP